jgi:transcriptional regulator GlxA family with amidase domain
MPELCALVAVSDRTSRLRCAEFLGASPTQYVLLRRLNDVNRALRDAGRNMMTVAEVAAASASPSWATSPRATGQHSARPH